GRPRVRTTTDLIEAVTGADFIFSAMRVGGTEARALDEEIALEHGVLGQETVGVGGMAYALRTIPEARHLAGVIAEHAPEAWVINFTNPAGVITQAMREQLGGRVVGICDSPISLVARIEDLTGSRATSFDYAGLNHAGWLRGLRGRPEGSDRVEDLLARVLGDEQLLNQLDEARLLGVDVIRSIGAIPNEYHYYYSHTREAHGRIAERVPRGRQLAEQQETFYSAAAAEPERALELWLEALREREETYGAETRTDPATRRTAHEIELGGYQKVALQLMRVLSGVDGPTRMILNVPNSPGTGRLIRQLSRRAVIEVACDVSIDAIIPAPVGRLHSDLAGLLVQLKGCDELLLRATERKDPVAALRAFATHPLVDSVETARALLASYCERIPGVAEAIGAA
nr:6-phospho-beta-glucosidase [Actinomycetales bacterium]